MKGKVAAFSREYEIALSVHLEKGAGSSLKTAARFGRRAVLLGLETLDLARIHERALLAGIALKASTSGRDSLAKRAQPFFIEAITPIEQTHLAFTAAKDDWIKVRGTLHERTGELAVSRRSVRKRIVERKAAEQSLKRESEQRAKSLKESRSLLESLRALSHRVISAQENERGQISRELHDEIAQILLGINVRLLTLQQKDSGDTQMLLQEIAAAQRLVEKSVKDLRRFARKLQSSEE